MKQEIKHEEKKDTPKPTFEALIQQQHSDGFWTKAAEDVLKNFIVDGNVIDDTVRALLSSEVKFGKNIN